MTSFVIQPPMKPPPPATRIPPRRSRSFVTATPAKHSLLCNLDLQIFRSPVASFPGDPSTESPGKRAPSTEFRSSMNVSIIGLGKLGAPMAAVFAARGHHVIGLDVNPIFLEKLAAGKAPIEEPRLQEMLDAGRDRLRVTSSHEELVANSEITFIIVPTPSDRSGA